MKIGFWIAWIFTIAALPFGRAVGQESFPEYKVKAAFLFNFVKFVKWPEKAFENAAQPFSIVILGSDPFGESLEQTFQGKLIEGRFCRIVRVRQVEEALGAHLLFIGRSEEVNLQTILDRTRDRPILTVSELTDFAKNWGMVELKVIDRQVCFDLNQERLKRLGMSASGQMVKIARNVYR
jgi:hypothetical protein